MTDKEILDLYNSGERKQAFNVIVRTYGEKLYYHIRRMVAIHEDADDCLQNTLIKAWNALETFRGDCGLYTWLYRIATNETITFLRKQRLRGFFSPVDFAERLSADPTFNGDKLQAALQKAIAKLPPKQRAVFTMRYWDELPYEQISEILGTSIGALKASYHHADKKVKEWVLNFYEN
ncbi:MAG: RNA polymerase sigma factor [Bacteroidales bacterium]|nr:RNA polymerase sigma factor [Candidatus Cacconaster caballi]